MTVAEQRLSALQLANRVRLVNAETCRRLNALPTVEGMHEAAALLANPSDELLRMPIHRLLGSVRRFGEMRTLDACKYAGCSLHRRIDTLTDRQRRLLIGVLLDPSLVWPGSKYSRRPAA